MDVNYKEGIIAFMDRNASIDCIGNMYSEWKKMAQDANIEEYIRKDCSVDAWFQKCYQAREELECVVETDMMTGEALTRRDILYNEFINIIDQKTQNECDHLQKIQWEQTCVLVKENGPSWVSMVIELVEREQNLVNKYTQEFAECFTEHDGYQQMGMPGDLCRLHSLRKDLKQDITHVSAEKQRYKELEKKKEDKSKLAEVLRHNKGKYIPLQNGPKFLIEEKHVKEAFDGLENIKKSLDDQHQKMKLCVEKCVEKFKTLLTGLNTVVRGLEQRVDDWKKKFHLKYAGLAANPELDEIAAWCSEVGKLLHDLQKEEFVELSKYNDVEDFSVILDQLVSLQVHFMQRTFVVTEQTDFIFKKKRKKQMTIVVQILGAGNLPHLSGTEIRAFPLHEKDFHKCCHGDDLDLTKLEGQCQKYFKTGGTKALFSCTESTVEAEFKDLAVADVKVQRSDEEKHVYERRLRIVFVTQITCGDASSKAHKFWTLSPPAVLTTGANQECLSQASIMWESYRMNTESVLPFPETDVMPWSRVVDMLDCKMRSLCQTHGLTVENRNHLKKRLLGDAEKPDDTPVTLKTFCFDKLSQPPDKKESNPTNFSFWQWFVAAYNLINKYLLPYWKNGWIHGFVSNDDGIKMLKEHRKNGGMLRDGMFILRFSDYNIVSSQGLTTSYAYLTSCLLKVKRDPSGTIKQKVTSCNVASPSALEKMNLAKVLHGFVSKSNEKLYKVLYPGNVTREESFDILLESEVSTTDQLTDRYIRFTETRTVDELEEKFGGIAIDTGKHTSSHLDTGDDASAQHQSTSGMGFKRQRTEDEDDSHMFSVLEQSLGVFSPAQMSDCSQWSTVSQTQSLLSPQQSPFPPTPSPLDTYSNHGNSPQPQAVPVLSDGVNVMTDPPCSNMTRTVDPDIADSHLQLSQLLVQSMHENHLHLAPEQLGLDTGADLLQLPQTGGIAFSQSGTLSTQGEEPCATNGNHVILDDEAKQQLIYELFGQLPKHRQEGVVEHVLGQLYQQMSPVNQREFMKMNTEKEPTQEPMNAVTDILELSTEGILDGLTDEDLDMDTTLFDNI